MKSKTKVFTDKQLQQIVDYRSEIDYSVWKRRIGSNRVVFYFTYGDSRAISKLIGIDVINCNDNYIAMRQELSDYIKAKGLYKDNYDTDKITQPHYCDKCGQRIS